MSLRVLALVPMLALASPVLAQSTQDQQDLTRPNMGQRHALGPDTTMEYRDAGEQDNMSVDNSPERLNSADREFLRSAAMDNKAEIELSLMAEQRSTDGAVKAFSRLMIDDHTALASQLAFVANAEKLELPNGIGHEGQSEKSRLMDLHGPQFDIQFIRHQVEDHTKDIREFDRVATSSQNQRVRALAEMALPVLQQHLDLARAVENSLPENSRRVER